MLLVFITFFFVSDGFMTFWYPRSAEIDCAAAVFIGTPAQTVMNKATFIISGNNFDTGITLTLPFLSVSNAEQIQILLSINI
jgi:hypothetical protein